ncbi:MAG: serine/threonine-protein kinase [Nocardioides sp.]
MTTTPRPDGGYEQAPPGLTVGPYTLLSRIGEGGMGVVHLARTDDGRRVALKVLRPHIIGDDEVRARLAREVSSLGRIRSRWVAEIVDADPWGDIPYVATRYVPGLSLHDHVVEEGAITGTDLTWFAGCLAEGLASVHEVGVLHRDVKPSNVLMEGRTPILIDFGLARVADDPKLTHTGWLLGTPGYLAPEILYGDDATAASDVHSWAATVAYAGLGRAPFGRGPSMAIMDRVRRGQHDLEGLPPDLRGVVAAALDPEPGRRPGLDELLEWLRPQTTQAHPVVPPPPTGPVDVYTMPLAIAGQAAAQRSTDVLGGEDPTTVEPRTRVYDTEVVDTWGEPVEHGRPPVPVLERLGRLLLLLGLALLVGAGAAAYPWPTVALVLVATWLLRSGSLAASAVGDRRVRRGRKWYDGAQLLLGAPWDLVRSLPGTFLLALWSAGLATAAALVCYGASASTTTTLFVSGTVLGASLWLGPGSSRVRSPVGRAVNPLAAEGRRFAVALVLLLLLAGATGFRVDTAGTSWLPGTGQPFAGWKVPSGLHLPMQ